MRYFLPTTHQTLRVKPLQMPMNTHTTRNYFRTLCGLFALTAALTVHQVSAQSLSITGYVNPSGTKGQGAPIFGSSTDVPGSGTAANFLAVNPGAFVDFLVGDANNPSAGTVAHLRVTMTAISANTQVMLARTSNSQGLEDPSTISLLIGRSATPAIVNTATINFSWFTPNGNFDTPLSSQYTITTYDIDFKQYNEMLTADLDTVYLADTINTSASTNLIVTTEGAYTRVSDPSPGTNSIFNAPENAAVFRTAQGSSQTIRVGKVDNSVGNQLYMFEFRNPPSNVDITIPEPSVSIIGLVGAVMLMSRRRRPCAA